uniref:hypothetical protein n=1 Tax=uncultured Rhizobium sp. TaxID=155567 RepID=UPI0026069522|nr:hypothetical protein [uncultured Rhizobium sp.]
MRNNVYLPLGTLWPRELENFTPFIADNLDVLSQLIGIGLIHLASHRRGGYGRKIGKRHNTGFVDILARNEHDHSNVVIENQINPADGGHWRRILQYASGQNASLVIWIAESFSDEILAVIEKHNQAPDATFQVCAIALRVPAILPLASYFEVVARPVRGHGSTASLPSILPCIGELDSLAPLWATLQILYPGEGRRSRQQRYDIRVRRQLIGGWRVEWQFSGGGLSTGLGCARPSTKNTPRLNLQAYADLIETRLGVRLICKKTGRISPMRYAISAENGRDLSALAEWMHVQANALEAVLRELLGSGKC